MEGVSIPIPAPAAGWGYFPSSGQLCIRPCLEQSPKNACGHLALKRPELSRPLQPLLLNNHHVAKDGRWRAAKPGAWPGECDFCPRAGVGPRNHLIWLGQQKTRLGMPSSGGGGAVGWVSLFSSHAGMRACTGSFLLLQLSECSRVLEQQLALAFLSCIPAPHPFLLLSSLPECLNGCGHPVCPLRKEKSPWPGQCPRFGLRVLPAARWQG